MKCWTFLALQVLISAAEDTSVAPQQNSSPHPHGGVHRGGGHDTNTYGVGEDPYGIGSSAKSPQLRSCKFPERRTRLYAANGNVRVLPNENVTHGTVLRFHCRPLGETRLVGNKWSQCMNGRWSNQVPHCDESHKLKVVIRLKDTGLKDTAKTAVSPDGYLYIVPGFEVEMECESYYYPPRLEMIEPVSSWKMGGVRSIRKSYHGEDNYVSAKFSLPEDYEGIVRCPNDTKYSTQIIKIRGRYLHSCKIPAHSDATLVTRENNETVTVACKPPYVLRGEARAVCLAHSEWEKPFPECVVPAPSNISKEPRNVNLQSAKPVLDQTTEIPRLKDPSNLKCKVLPIENAVYLSDVNNNSSEIQLDKQFANGTSIYFHCRGDRTSYRIRCSEGFWKPAPSCLPEEQTCDVNNFLRRVPPEVVIKANVSEVAAGTVYHAFCKNTGYIFDGQSRVVCNADGKWAFDPSMRCNRLCAIPPLAPGVNIVRRTAAEMRFACQRNLALEGPEQIHCSRTGEWDAKPPVCVQPQSVKGCPIFPDQDESLIIEGILPTYQLGDSITLSCPGGTELDPPVERITCLGDRWSETKLPHCLDRFPFRF